jgi:hypothetical protein
MIKEKRVYGIIPNIFSVNMKPKFTQTGKTFTQCLMTSILVVEEE